MPIAFPFSWYFCFVYTDFWVLHHLHCSFLHWITTSFFVFLKLFTSPTLSHTNKVTAVACVFAFTWYLFSQHFTFSSYLTFLLDVILFTMYIWVGVFYPKLAVLVFFVVSLFVFFFLRKISPELTAANSSLFPEEDRPWANIMPIFLYFIRGTPTTAWHAKRCCVRTRDRKRGTLGRQSATCVLTRCATGLAPLSSFLSGLFRELLGSMRTPLIWFLLPYFRYAIHLNLWSSLFLFSYIGWFGQLTILLIFKFNLEAPQ